MQEEAQVLFPARSAWLPLSVLWVVSLIGILFFAGLNIRSFCGAVFAAALIWLSYLDIRDGLLYDAITIPFALFGFVPVLTGLISLREALIGGTLCGVLFYCLYILARGGLGGGDVKFAAGLGVWLGWEAAVIAVWTAFMLGGAVAALLHHAAQGAARWDSVRALSRHRRLYRICRGGAALAALLGNALMRGKGIRGMALLNVLIALSVLSIVLAVALPAALSLYARAAVEYEALHLVAELRRIQAISRTTAVSLSMLDGKQSKERVPRLRIRSDGYVLHRPFGEDRHYAPLPLVRFDQETAKNTVIAFDPYGNITWDRSHNMTIRVYVPKQEGNALRVVIDRAARIRMQRGEQERPDEE